jgi:hypothetical protein
MDLVQVQHQLIALDRLQNLGAVVIESAMPHVLLKLESFLELGVEGLSRDSAAGVQSLAGSRFQKGSSGSTMGLARLPFPRSSPGFPGRSSRGAALDQRTHEATPRATPVRSPLDRFREIVGVIRLIGQDRFCLTRQIRHLLADHLRFVAIGGFYRGQQRPDRPAFSRGNDRLIPISIDPAIVFALTPPRFEIGAAHAAGSPVATMSRRALCGDQTFVRRDTLRIRPLLFHGQFAFAGDRHLQQPPSPQVAIEKSRTLRQRPYAQRLQFLGMSPAITKLGRLGFPPCRHGNNNQRADHPIRHHGLSSPSCSRAALLGLLTAPHRQHHKLPKQFPRRYTGIHPWISGVVSVLLHNENQPRSKDLCQSEFPDSLTQSRETVREFKSLKTLAGKAFATTFAECPDFPWLLRPEIAHFR